ncbi:MAG: hypothetical protein HY709_12010, partial [Candidatus Latescibacteria bacterium]|nr:hypothetical protein [Candidatus Latescibacterota bacterium]
KVTGKPPVTYTGSSAVTRPDVIVNPTLRPKVKGRSVGDHWEAQGPAETIDFAFTIPPDLSAESAEIVATVLGDYRIGVRQVHDFKNLQTGNVEERSWPSPPTQARFNLDFKDRLPYNPEPFYTVVRAEGTPSLSGSREVVRFHHSIPTGQSFYGLNWGINAKLLSVKAEFVANPQDFIFPIKGGDRDRKPAYAGFLRFYQRVEEVGRVGGEIFRLDPTYGGWYDSRRGGAVFYTNVAGDAKGGEQTAIGTFTQEFPLYDDNDDHDVWPDDITQGIDWPYVPKGAFENVQYLGGRPESGVYPGFDVDGDRIFDIDKNRSGVGDWLEPFFEYDTDPPEFVYDVDFNNNGLPDFRENDDSPDYPYQRDQQGLHILFDLDRRPSWLDRSTVGWYRIREIAGGGTSRAIYYRTAAHTTIRGLSLTFSDDVKRVKDDIHDDVYRFYLTTDTKLSQRFNLSVYPPPPDPLLMRDSFVNTAFLETHYTLFDHLELFNNFKHVLNSRRKLTDRQGKLLQDARTLHNFMMVNKVGYTIRLFEAFTVMTRAKHLMVKWDEGSYVPVDTLNVNPEASWSMFTPSVKMAYRLTPKTSLEYGQSGLFTPALRTRYTDRANPANSFTDNLSILQVTMTGTHQAYEVIANIGVRWWVTSYDARSKKPEERFSAFFLDMVLGIP